MTERDVMFLITTVILASTLVVWIVQLLRNRRKDDK